MKTHFARNMALTAAILTPLTASSQIVVQHLGASDPETEGFFRSEFGNPILGSVFDDFGHDAWRFDARRRGQEGLYVHRISSEQQQAALTHGWEVTVRMRMVELGGYGRFTFGADTTAFWIDLKLNGNGDIEVRNRGNVVYTLISGGDSYHEYSVVYDAADAAAALWVGGVPVAELAGSGTQPGGELMFGGAAGITHWNEVTLTIIPEPAAVTLVAGMGVLLGVGAIRWRRNRAPRPH